MDKLELAKILASGNITGDRMETDQALKSGQYGGAYLFSLLKSVFLFQYEYQTVISVHCTTVRLPKNTTKIEISNARIK